MKESNLDNKLLQEEKENSSLWGIGLSMVISVFIISLALIGATPEDFSILVNVKMKSIISLVALASLGFGLILIFFRKKVLFNPTSKELSRFLIKKINYLEKKKKEITFSQEELEDEIANLKTIRDGIELEQDREG